MKSFAATVRSFFVDYLPTERGRPLTTIESYRDGMKLFVKYLCGSLRIRSTSVEWSVMTHRRVLGFLQWLEETRGNSISTRNQRLAMLHSFFDFAGKEEPSVLELATRVNAISFKSVNDVEMTALSQEQVRVFLASMPGEGRLAQRDRGLIAFLYGTGARASEASKASVQDVDFRRCVVVLHGKGNKDRVVPVDDLILRHLRRELERPGVPVNRGMPLFCTRDGRALSRKGVHSVVRRHALPLEKAHPLFAGTTVTPHVFRHTFATHALEAGTPINVLRKWMGHVWLSTTERYTHLSLQDKKRTVRKSAFSEDELGFAFNKKWKKDRDLLQFLDSLGASVQKNERTTANQDFV